MNDKAQKELVVNPPKGTQFLEVSNTIAVEVCRCLESGGVGRDGLQQIVSDKETLMKIALRNSHDILQLVAPEIMTAKAQLAIYFKVVFGLKLNFTKFRFPRQESFSSYMVVPSELNEDDIMEAFAKRWGSNKNLFRLKRPVTSTLDRTKEQKRPRGTYVFAHKGGGEPDEVFSGASYDNVAEMGINFANIKEYLLMTGFHKFKQDCFLGGINGWARNYEDRGGEFMDQNGWTRTSSFYTDGSLILGHGGEDDPRGRLAVGDRSHNSRGDGPRHIILLAA